jgi:hypothetical protein
MLKLVGDTTQPEQTTALIPATSIWSNILMTIRILAFIGSGALGVFQMLSRHQIAELWVWLQGEDGTRWGVMVLTYATPVALGAYALIRNTKAYKWARGLVTDRRVSPSVAQIKGTPGAAVAEAVATADPSQDAGA